LMNRVKPGWKIKFDVAQHMPINAYTFIPIKNNAIILAHTLIFVKDIIFF
jgi:hypothetical protein